MIIDEILDRKCAEEEGDFEWYNPHDFYMYCMEESGIFDGIGDAITRAMDFGTENDVRNAICNYIIDQNYNPDICKYVRSVQWIFEE